ncbi:MAG: hypothetical protein ACK5O9_07940 [Holosporales bacterium]|jgi:hypothetical protein
MHRLVCVLVACLIIVPGQRAVAEQSPEVRCTAKKTACVDRAEAGRFLARIFPTDTQMDDVYGGATALGRDIAVVGAPWDSERAYRAGSVYVYRRAKDGAWNVVAKIFAPNPQSRAFFGSAVAIDDNAIVVGAPGVSKDANISTGAAYVFRIQDDGSVVPETTLQRIDARAGDFFGASVALNKGTVVIGSHLADGAAADSGAVYFFSRKDKDAVWVQSGSLQPDGLKAGTLFGSAISLGRDFLAVGAYGYDGSAPGGGGVYLYRRKGDNFVFHSLLEPPARKAFAEFGWSVALSGERLVIGSPYEDSGNPVTGTAYVFSFDPKKDQWTIQGRLTATGTIAQERFGASVAVDDGTVVVGAPFGFAFIFGFEAAKGWRPHNIFVGAMPMSDRLYSRAVAVAEGTVLIGVPNQAGGRDAAGSAYLFGLQNAVRR